MDVSLSSLSASLDSENSSVCIDSELDLSLDTDLSSLSFAESDSFVSSDNDNDIQGASSDDDNDRQGSTDFHEGLHQPLYVGSKLSTFDTYLVILKYALRHSLTKQALSDLLNLVRLILPTSSMILLYN